MTTGAETHGGEVSLLQAKLFCIQLHAELVKLEQVTGALEATLARQLARVGLRQHALITEQDLTRATADRDHVLKMLAALGHPYPCEHRGAEDFRGDARPASPVDAGNDAGLR